MGWTTLTDPRDELPTFSDKRRVRLVTAAALDAYTATSQTITINAHGTLTVDTVLCATGDRVLVSNDGTATGADRGLYFVEVPGSADPGGTSAVLRRVTDADGDNELFDGMLVAVAEGANAGSLYEQTSSEPITIGTTSLSFTKLVPGGGSAPVGASYLVLGVSAVLTNERVFTPGTSLAFVDNGAGNTFTLDAIQDIRTSAAPTFAGLGLTKDDANNASVIDLATWTHTTSGAPAAGIGTGQLLRTEFTGGIQDLIATRGVATNVGAGTEQTVIDWWTRNAGAALAARLRLNTPTGYTQLAAQVANDVLVLSPNGTGGVQAHLTDSAAPGGNARGTNAVDWQTVRNAAGQVASGARSTVLGGGYNTASGQESIAGGYSCIASGTQSVALGSSCQATNTAASAVGSGAIAALPAELAHSGGVFAVAGDCQHSWAMFRRQTTDATATELTLTGGAPGASTRLGIASGRNYEFRIDWAAAQTGGGAGTAGDMRWGIITGAIKNVAGTTSLVGALVTTADGDAAAAGWTCVATADDANDALVLTGTAEANKSVNWTATIHLTRVR